MIHLIVVLTSRTTCSLGGTVRTNQLIRLHFSQGPGRRQTAQGGAQMSDLRETVKNRLVMPPGHFAHPMRVDEAEEIGSGVYLLIVRDSSGHLDERVVTVTLTAS